MKYPTPMVALIIFDSACDRIALMKHSVQASGRWAARTPHSALNIYHSDECDSSVSIYLGKRNNVDKTAEELP